MVAVTAAATDFTAEEAMDSTVEAVDSMVEAMVSTEAATDIMAMVTTVIMVTTATMATTTIMGTHIIAAGIRGSGALVGAIRGTGIRPMGIPTTVIMIRITTLTPATTEIPVTTGIHIIAIRITTDIMAPRPTATQGILITDTGMELATAEDITRIPARGIATQVGCITADSAC